MRSSLIHVSESVSEGWSIRKNISRHGAIPNETLSAIESNSLPNREVLPLARATLPSSASQKNDASMQIIART